MEKQLKYVLLLSLEEMALRSVAAFLWNDSNILASISKFRFSEFSSQRREEEWLKYIEETTKDKILKLGLPESLTKQMSDVVRPISLEVREWKLTFQWYFSHVVEEYEIGLPNSAKLCFTTAGTINYRKTAEELVRCKALDIELRYRIACYYCLEYYIPLLWEELPEEKKQYFCGVNWTLLYLDFFWPHILRGDYSKLDNLLRVSNRNLTTFNQCAFEFSVEWQCKTAAEYFFQKLTTEEKEASLMRIPDYVISYPEDNYPAEKFSDVFFYLFSLMNPGQQMEIVKARPEVVFSHFFYWPWQDLLMKNASLIWVFLLPSNYSGLIEKMKNAYSDFYSPKLFQEFFMQSPPDFKKCFVESASTFLRIFFTSGDLESIEVLFRNIDAADRVKILFDLSVLELLSESIFDDRWDVLEVCVREAKLSRNDRQRLKTDLMECNDHIRNPRVTCQLDGYFKFLCDTDDSDDLEKSLEV